MVRGWASDSSNVVQVMDCPTKSAFGFGSAQAGALHAKPTGCVKSISSKGSKQSSNKGSKQGSNTASKLADGCGHKPLAASSPPGKRHRVSDYINHEAASDKEGNGSLQCCSLRNMRDPSRIKYSMRQKYTAWKLMLPCRTYVSVCIHQRAEILIHNVVGRISFTLKRTHLQLCHHHGHSW